MKNVLGSESRPGSLSDSSGLWAPVDAGAEPNVPLPVPVFSWGGHCDGHRGHPPILRHRYFFLKESFNRLCQPIKKTCMCASFFDSFLSNWVLHKKAEHKEVVATFHVSAGPKNTVTFTTGLILTWRSSDHDWARALIGLKQPHIMSSWHGWLPFSWSGVNFCLVMVWHSAYCNNTFSCLDPVPGACNMEFNLDIDPNIYVHYNLYETTIRFAPANLGYER